MSNGKNNNLNQQLRNIASGNGVDHFGIADLSQAHAAILEQGGSFIASFPFLLGYPYLIQLSTFCHNGMKER